MKKLTILLSFMCISLFTFAQVKIGQHVADIPIDTILNAPVTRTNLKSMEGKIVLLDFWATWCRPCVEGMSHLQELQKDFIGKLQVITITNEKENRINQFLANRPSNLWFAIDSTNELRKTFPNRTIPHSVLIDTKGIVIAITEPGNITPSVITDILAGKRISLPVKEDIILNNPWETFFPADSTTVSRFVIQPEIKGISGQSRIYGKPFANRRYSVFNLTLQTIYRSTYSDFSHKRVIDMTKKNSIQNNNLYSMDIIVPKGQERELFPSLRKELQARFDIHPEIQKRTKPVYVLKIADKDKIAKFQQSAASETSFVADGAGFKKQSVRFKTIAEYLEKYNTGVKLPVVDETGDSNYYNIEFSFMREKPGDLEAQLYSLGLKLIPAEREIEILVIKEK